MKIIGFDLLKWFLRPVLRWVRNNIMTTPVPKTDFEAKVRLREAEQQKWSEEISERKELAKQFANSDGLSISTKQGLALIKNEKEGNVEAALEVINDIVESGIPLSSKKKFLRQYELDITLPINSPLIDLVTSDSVLGAATRYLGQIPMVNIMLISYSPKNRPFEGSSQYYHLDGHHYPLDVDEPTQIKLVMLACDADEESGPFTALTREASKEAYKALVGKKRSALDKNCPQWNAIIEHGSRIDDDTMYKYCDRSNVNKLVGKRGDMMLVDTNRCYHYGSRPGSKDRWVFFVEFFRADDPELFHGDEIDRPLPSWLTEGLAPREKRIRELLFQNYQRNLSPSTAAKMIDHKAGELSISH